ncbi:MAG: TIGR02444 family protein [Porticoccaceae bacterium]|nr:TIGR02444 family protein [Porticoccaceae bacterium]
MPDSTNLLWRYSLALYSDIEPWCLQMQDEYGADVNLLLLCCFAGDRGCRLSSPQLEEARQCIASWQQHLVEPLRQLRRQLPSAPLDKHYSSARQLLLDAELNAERHSQNQLWLWWQQQSEASLQPAAKAIVANLNLYTSQLDARDSVPPLPATVINCALRAVD